MKWGGVGWLITAATCTHMNGKKAESALLKRVSESDTGWVPFTPHHRPLI